MTWIGNQIRGTASNVRSLFSSATLKGLLPPSWYSTLIWIRDTLPRSLGFTGSRIKQLTGVVAFSIVLVIASASLLTYVAIVYLIIFGSIGLLRLIPAVHRRWPFSASSWPLWTVRE